jgi:acyl-CoA dehydrogenase
MMIFGQGAIRCHPYVLKEIAAAGESDPARASEDFDSAFWGHAGFFVSNVARSLLLGLSGARLTRAPGAPVLKRYYQQLTRMSAAFAFAADLSMMILGGDLKRKEKLSGRLGDILSELYLASAVLKRFEDDGRQQDDLPLVHWALQDALARIQQAFYGVFQNFPNRYVATVMRLTVFPWGRVFSEPEDRLGSEIARLMMEPSETRERLSDNSFVWRKEDDPVGCLELALEAAPAGEAAETKLRAVIKADNIDGFTESEQLDNALHSGAMTDEEANALRRFWKLRRRCIMVDDFPKEIGRNNRESPHDAVVTPLDGTYSR